jgi:predicted double-glycine peptidase
MWRRTASLVLTALLAAALPVQARPVQSLLEMRTQGVVLQKWDISCGAAALATLLTYQLHDPVSERQVALAMLHGTDPLKVKYRGGFSLLDMKKYAASRGFEADGYEGMTIADLVKMAPLIVPIHILDYYHFVIVRGLVGDRVVLADPAYGNRTMPLDEFMQSWNSGIGFVVSKLGVEMPNNMTPRASDFVSSSSDIIRNAARIGTYP